MKYFFIPIGRTIFAILWMFLFRPLILVLLLLSALWEWDAYDFYQKWRGPFFEYCHQSYITDIEGYAGVYNEYHVYQTFFDLVSNRYRIRKDQQY